MLLFLRGTSVLHNVDSEVFQEHLGPAIVETNQASLFFFDKTDRIWAFWLHQTELSVTDCIILEAVENEGNENYSESDYD